MFNANRFARVATAAVGAIVLSTLSIAAAVPVGATAAQPAQTAPAQSDGAHA